MLTFIKGKYNVPFQKFIWMFASFKSKTMAYMYVVEIANDRNL